jgi:hypothetical protein
MAALIVEEMNAIDRSEDYFFLNHSRIQPA